MMRVSQTKYTDLKKVGQKNFLHKARYEMDMHLLVTFLLADKVKINCIDEIVVR